MLRCYQGGFWFVFFKSNLAIIIPNLNILSMKELANYCGKK